MTQDQFWEIVEKTMHPRMEVNRRKLFEELSKLQCEELIKFDRFWSQCLWDLHTNLLGCVAEVYLNGCSNDGFRDWCDWVVSKGRRMFQVAHESPDELLDLILKIEDRTDVGREGIGYVRQEVAAANGSQCEQLLEESVEKDFDLIPDQLSGPNPITAAEFERLLPKTFKKFICKELSHIDYSFICSGFLDNILDEINEDVR